MNAKFDTLFGDVGTLEGPPGLQTSLGSKLNTALKLAQGGNPCASAKVLGAFINHLEAKAGRTIPSETASSLIAQAQSLIDQLLLGVNCHNDPDRDSDGLGRRAEEVLGTDPRNADTDGDTIGDGVEVLGLGTNPLIIDTDGDGTPDGGYDPDQDGCTTGAEAAPASEATHGGGRDPVYYWDFMDMWVNNDKDKVVNIIDIGALAQRFGAVGDPEGDPLDPPQALTGYHVSADRTAPVGPNLWNAGPPDGVINIIEIALTAVQFGHACN